MSGRAQRMEEDVQAVIAACKADKACPFKNFQWNSNHLTFDYSKDSTNRHYMFNLSDDYPEHTMITRSDKPDDSIVTSQRIPVVFNNLARELYTEMSISFKPDSVSAMESGDEVGDSDDYDEAQDTVDDLDLGAGDCRPSVDRMISMESGCTSDSWDDDYQDYYDEEEGDEDNNMNTLLGQDMEMVKQMYGDQALSHRLFGTIDDIDVELNINMSFLDTAIAKAWKVIRDEPITVRLHLSLSRYLDATDPKVEVFQPSQKEKFGIGSQLRKVMESFIRENWKNLSNEIVLNSYSKDQMHKLKRSTSSQPPTKKKSLLQTNSQPAPSRSPLRPDVPPTYPPVDDHKLAQIVDMGFSTEMSRNSLIITRGNFEEALNLLISSPESCTGVLADNQININVSAEQQHNLQSAAPVPNKSVRPKGPLGYQKVARDKKIMRMKSGGASPGTSTDDLTLMPSTTKSGKNAKLVPSLEHGFLVQVMKYVRQRLPTLNEYCVVCDESHVFQNGAMLKPAVCARELCVFAFQTLGVMSDAAEDIATGAEVVNLLIEMGRSACKSRRQETIFDPFPTVIHPHRPTEFILHPKKAKDFKRAEQALDSLMSVQTMTTLQSSDLKKKLDERDILSYPLLQWIISSNRSHIVKLPPEKQISFMRTPHQFLLMSSPPAKEESFKTAKKAHGSTFAFHGSNIENWHSIMRIGLINASGTKHQMHGAAYGNGIYLSPHASVSFGYSGMGYNRTGATNKSTGASSSRRFLSSHNLTCIALCEVITSSELRKSGNIWVCPNPDHVCTRFFFVYEDGQVGDNNIDMESEKYKKEILKAVSFQCV